MKSKGAKQKTIAETLGLTEGYVSKIVKTATRDGWLDAHGRLTEAGFMAIHGACDDDD